MAILFNHQTKKFTLKQKRKIREWILLTAYLEKKEIGDLSYVFCDDEYLLELNKKYLKHKTYTDIITFDYSSSTEINAEIYISTDRVRENALVYHTLFDSELNRIIIHGVLHCFGYSDKTPKSSEIMRKRENHFLKLLSELQ